MRALLKFFPRPLAFVVLTLALWGQDARAGTVRTLDGKTFEGDLRFNDSGALVLKPADGDPVTVDLKNVASAMFASGSFFSGGSILPNGWTANDYGDTRGFARLDTNTFILRVEGQTTNATACHFVSRTMPSDGEIIVRVDEVGGTGLTHAGIMMRGHNSSVFAALSLGSDGRIEFRRRVEPEKKEIRLTVGPKVSAPIWLRLQKNDKTVKALYTTDPKSWQTLSSDGLKLAPERTWREGEGELLLLRATFGVFASSRGVNTRGHARVMMAAMTQQGMVGEYFAERDFANLKMARLDPQIRFDWAKNPPDTTLDKTNFSVRWTGKIIPRKIGPFTFYLEADDRARLWIDEQEISTGSFKRSDRDPMPQFVALVAGRPAEVKLEFENGAGPASLKLGWALPNQKPEVIGMENFLYVFSGAKSPESIALARITNAGPVVRGVLLRNGTFIASPITKADESAVRLSFAGRKDVPVLNNRIARIFLRPPRQALPYEIAQGRGGVFMKNGDFFECDFRGIDHNSLTVNSVLFGLKKYGLEGSDALVVLLNDVVTVDSGFEVRLLDGSAWRTASVVATSESITLNDSILGSIAIPAGELVEIRQLGKAMADATSP